MCVDNMYSMMTYANPDFVLLSLNMEAVSRRQSDGNRQKAFLEGIPLSSEWIYRSFRYARSKQTISGSDLPQARSHSPLHCKMAETGECVAERQNKNKYIPNPDELIA